MIVMDTSVALEIAKGSPEGWPYRSLMTPRETCIAPTYFRVEIANAIRNQIRRQLIPAKRAVEYFDRSLSLMDMLWPSADLFPEALTEAVRMDHPVYDIAYLVLARRFGATLFSRDRRLNELCDECGVMRIHDVEF